ncbi:DUF3800 domain-containing protein [Oceanicola sp. D3]|uniref:DUF3800 domain-containing protein n=1 Tax=Oceanicola sp. D3 TaxID=2587163 RepID=UPI00143D24C2
MYVDESGDPGNNVVQTRYFCLTGMVVHESRWRQFHGAMREFRRNLKDVYGFPVREEIHAVKLLRHSAFDIPKHIRLGILRNLLDELRKQEYVRFTSVVMDKLGKPADFDVFGASWRTLFQRFENTLLNGNFPGSHADSFGTIYTDATSGERLNKLMRKMSAFNPIPNQSGDGYRDIPVERVIEDPSSRDSKHSLFIQSCDVAAYFLFQGFQPNSYILKKGARSYYRRLEPVLNLYATRRNELGIVCI